MTKNQLKASIAKITQAIQLISTTEGYYYDKAHATTDLMVEQKRRMEKELHTIEFNERKIQRLETRYSLLEAQLDKDLDKLSDEQIDALRGQLELLYDNIKHLRGE